MPGLLRDYEPSDGPSFQALPRKPYTFDDRVADYRAGIKQALRVTERKEETEAEMDLLFAEVVDESAASASKTEDITTKEQFTPMCTPKKNRKDLLGSDKSYYSIMILIEILPGCEEGEWDSDWDEETSDDHPNINKEKNMMFV